ncbi:MAG: hypothetical protein ABSG59_04235 [Verrucomicrobiota bacterium]|jgi:hypothetical protein
MKRGLVPVVLCVAFSGQCFAQAPPPNDNFSNRIVLSGSQLTFSATLAGATVESNEYFGSYMTVFPCVTPTQSVWWTWTAPQTSLVVLEMIGASADSVCSDLYPLDGVAVYDTTNVFSGAQPTTNMGFDLSMLCEALTFSAVAGSNYQIQVLGSSSDTCQLLLVATNNPVILQQPRSLTVSSNASTLFTAVADGYRPLSYQWQCNGSNLPGQTVSMLALTNIDGPLAGSYSVVVSNSGGVVTSSPGVLVVSSSNAPPSLAAMSGQPGQFDFQLTGETGRNYRIEFSTDLAGWTNEYAFPRTPYSYYEPHSIFSPYLTSIVFNTNPASMFVLNTNVPCEFLRASQYAPANEICVNNLRQIRFAKLLWRRQYFANHTRVDTPIGMDLAPYFPQRILPHCPEDPQASFPMCYIPGDASFVPVCIIDASHILEEPQ